MKHGQKLATSDTEKVLSTVVSRINRIRVAQKVSQRRLSHKAKVAAITIAKAESGEHYYSLHTTIRLCKALNITLSELFADI